jgi:hypothetical protein
VKIIEPGGVLSTDFGKRSAAEAAHAQPIADYAPFIANAMKLFGELRANRSLATAEEVAEVIFAAATDGTRQLRYVATADIEPLVTARREGEEDAYIALMRGRFERQL